MKIQQQYTIGAHTFTVELRENFASEGQHGKSILEKLHLIFDENAPQTLLEETLIHEVLHMIRELNGTAIKDEDEEERVVQADAHLLYHFLKSNNLLK